MIWRTFLQNHAKELIALDFFTIRRECLNHVIVLGERRLRRILRSYIDYYNKTPTHLSLDKDTPEGRPIERPDQGKVIELKHVGGLHHECVRRAA